MRIRIIILSACLSGLFDLIWGQTASWSDSLPYLPDTYNERFFLQTDRYIYAVGERILFKAFNISNPDIKKENWSKVMYMELIKPDGTPVKRAKFPLTANGFEGYLEIPENLLTGNYYIVVYTKWMRNFSPADYTYNMIKIINPFKPLLEESCNYAEDHSGAEKKTDQYDGGTKIQPLLKKDVIICRTNKNTYHPREEVVVTITMPGEANLSSAGCCLSVVRPGVVDAINYSFLSPDSVDFERGRFPEYIPETRGMSISGKIVSMENKEPLRNAHVQLSVLGNNPGFSAYNTQKNGNFFFVLNSLTGNHDMFITAEHNLIQTLEVLIDNDFSTDRIKFNSKPFELTETEKEKAREIVFNMQIEKQYKEDSVYEIKPEEQCIIPMNFYGKPSNIVYIDDYVELPTLEEVFIELVPEVSPVVRRKETRLIIKNEYYSNQSISIDPLILIDRLPVSDLEKILMLPPSKIQRIEVVNELYILGNIIYGGIISIFTKSNNLAGIDLPESSFFFNFQYFENQNVMKFPEYHNDAESKNMPDYRNCLYWEPDIHIDSSQTVQTHFYTSDSQEEFIIIVRGVTLAGEIIEGTCSFWIE